MLAASAGVGALRAACRLQQMNRLSAALALLAAPLHPCSPLGPPPSSNNKKAINHPSYNGTNTQEPSVLERSTTQHDEDTGTKYHTCIT